MAKKKISELPAGSALNGTELVPIVQTGTTKRITAQDIANLGNASGVEGSGTINYLAKFSATSTIANSQIFDNGTAIGIGTITPLGLLHLYKAAATTRMVMDGNASQSKIITYRTNGVQRFGLYLNNTPESGSNVGSDFQIRAYSDAGALLSTPLFIKRSTGELTLGSLVGTGSRMVVASALGVLSTQAIPTGTITGTGTTNYLPKFTGASALGNSIVSDNGTRVTIDGELRVAAADADINLQGTSKSYLLQIVDSDNRFRIYDNTANAERFTLTSAGNCGIGTTTPSEKLEVQNAAAGAKIKVSNSGGGYATLECSSNATSVAQLSFTNQLSLIGGNVGIGINNPAYTLDVNGTARVSGVLTFGGDTRYGVSKVYTAATGDMFGFEQVSAAQTGTGGAATRIFAADSTDTYISLGKYTNATNFVDYFRVNMNNGAATFASQVNIGNPVAAAVAVASTHKVTIVIGGVTYYLLATT
jgi:hypothetical protein